MASKVQICNMALLKVGANPITSLSDNTDQAKKCKLLYDDIADQVISEGAWSSATYRVTLAQTTNTPNFEYTYEYQLPTDPKQLRILTINEVEPGTNDYRIEGDKLLSDLATMSIKYIGSISDTESYDVYLKRAIEFRLASELAYPLTGDARLANRLLQQYKEFVMEGLALNGTQGSSDTLPATDLIKVR